jgi:hypothetical protein
VRIVSSGTERLWCCLEGVVRVVVEDVLKETIQKPK